MILHHWEIGIQTIYSTISQKCIGSNLFSWIRHCVVEVCAPPSALPVMSCIYLLFFSNIKRVLGRLGKVLDMLMIYLRHPFYFFKPENLILTTELEEKKKNFVELKDSIHHGSSLNCYIFLCDCECSLVIPENKINLKFLLLSNRLIFKSKERCLKHCCGNGSKGL